MANNAELFLAHLDSVFGAEDAIHKLKADDGGPPICVFIYNNVPEPGMITGVTYGLSWCNYPAWKFSRPEIIVSVKSASKDWPIAAATFVAMFRGQKKFCYGDMFTTDVAIAADSSMIGFFVFAQSILESNVASVQLPDYKINFSQFYPIYKEEVEVYSRIGLEAFWKHPNFDMYDVRRKHVRA